MNGTLMQHLKKYRDTIVMQLLKKSTRYKIAIFFVFVGLAVLNQNCSKGFQVSPTAAGNGGLGAGGGGGGGGTTPPPPGALPFANLDANDWNIRNPVLNAIFGVWQDTGATFVDPFFNTTFKRIAVDTAQNAAHHETTVMPFYAKTQPWSSDQQYMVTWASDGWIQLYDGGKGMGGHTPYQFIRDMDSAGSTGFRGCATDNEIRWSNDPATPHKFFHICFTQFYVYDADTNTDTLLADWGARLPGKNYRYVLNDAEGNPSSIKDVASGMYNRYWAFEGKGSSGNIIDIFVYDRFTDTTAPSAVCASNAACGIKAMVSDASINTCPGGSSDIDWVGMSPKGEHVIIVYGNTSALQTNHVGCGVGSYSVDTLAWEKQIMPTDWHGDVGLDINGDEVFFGMYEPLVHFTPTAQNAEFMSVRLSDGNQTRLQMFGTDDAGNTQSMFDANLGGAGFHVSMRGGVDPTHGIPGYALVSFYRGTGTTMAQYGNSLFGMGEQVVVKVSADESTTLPHQPTQAQTWRVGQTRSYRAAYQDEPHCCPSPDFSKTLCGTNWSTTATDPVSPIVTEF